MALDSKERFTDRVDDYVRHRPGYPRGVVELLVERARLGPGRVVADVGAGTGILTRLLLETGAHVTAVEPNAAMRSAADAALAADPLHAARYRSVAGSAEATQLGADSVHLVTAGQAFHWFDPAAARAEFQRILAPGGRVALVWNLRKDTPFIRDYDDMLARFAPDFGAVRMRERASPPHVRAFFAPSEPHEARFEHEQVFDEEGLRGRLLSASYAPRASHPMHAPMLARLDEIFRAHARGGRVLFPYETCVYEGELAPR